MIRFIWAQLRGRKRRTLALLAGVLVATTGFTVLSAGAAISQLRVNGDIQANYRPAYDILVRPKQSRTQLEDERGLVRPNYLSGLFGGISTAQLASVRAVPNVELGAPIAMLGYVHMYLEQTIDLTDQVDRNAERQLFRLSPSWIADRGLTVLDDAPKYVYLTRNPLYAEKFVVGTQPEGRLFQDGTELRNYLPNCGSSLEVRPDGTKVELCYYNSLPDGDGTSAQNRTEAETWQLRPDGMFVTPDPFIPRPPSARLIITVTWQVMVLVAAIDPDAESRLLDLDKAIVSGRYLTNADAPNVQHFPVPSTDPAFDSRYLAVPALFADTAYVDEKVQVKVARLGTGAASAYPGTPWREWVPRLATEPGSPAGPPVRSTGAPPLDQGSGILTGLSRLYQSGSTSYRVDEAGVLHPKVETLPPEFWTRAIGTGQIVPEEPPVFAFDNGFRPVTKNPARDFGLGFAPGALRVGAFDPGKLRGFSPLSKVPLETYQVPEATGADKRSKVLLGNEPLWPNSNPAGYLATPPLVLINLNSLDPIARAPEQVAAPISAIRVRVAGVTGFDKDSLNRVREVAVDIAQATGLDVDVTLGSSPAPQTVVLPAGKGGRPELTLSEGWSRKGVAVRIVVAADRKSVALFGLILVVCALFLSNAVAAAVRDRRRELAVLACLGWPPGRLAGVILGEVGLVGLAAGGIAAAIALPLSRVAGISVTAGHALLALPIGVGLALLGAAAPALTAARARPAAAVHPAVLGVRRVRRRRTVLGLAMANLRRVPGRTVLGVVALAVGISALTMLMAISVAFHNDVIGTVLGDTVAVRVRAVDMFAAGAALLLGVLAVGDVLYINVRERSGELAALWAAGWSDRVLLRLLTYEGLGIGVLGALVGAGAGIGGVAWIVGDLNRDIVWLTVIVAASAVVVAGLAAAVPALLLRRFPLATLLAEE